MLKDFYKVFRAYNEAEQCDDFRQMRLNLATLEFMADNDSDCLEAFHDLCAQGFLNN